MPEIKVASKPEYEIDFENSRIKSPSGRFLYVDGQQSFIGVLNFVQELNTKKGKK